uniref:Cytochrome P450 n=1 Tax=Anopheles melas TaxID=34690 RepID=A0A182UK02_9DIPT
MLATTTLLLWGVAISLLLYALVRPLTGRPGKNFPPGPPGRFPFLGDYALLLLINYRHLHKAALVLGDYYRTKILGITLRDYPTIVVNDLTVAKEVLNRKVFDGRPDLYLARIRDRDYNRRGIFFTDGPSWKEQRWFILRYLRDYGFGRRFPQHEAEVNSELLVLIDLLRYGPKHGHERAIVRDDGYAKCPNVLFSCFANAFLQIVSGERLSREETGVLYETGANAMVFQREGDDYGTILSYFPNLRYIFPFSRKFQRIRQASMNVNGFIETIIDKYLRTFDENHVRCFLDLYFREMVKCTPQEPNFTFQHDQLLLGLVDFFFPAISGATTQMALLFERLLHNPPVIERMQREIDEVVGHGRLPTLDDRTQLAYTEATLREAMRIDTLVPSGIAHRVQEDTTLHGYELPKDTLVVIGLDAIHNQREYWGDPERFRPERFLDEHGRLSLAKDLSVPFGAGKRLCAGETFARNIMFLTLAALMQNFNIRQPPNARLPDLSKRNTGVIIAPEDFWLKFEPRLAHFYRTKVLGLFLAGLPAVIVRDGEIARKLLTRRELHGRPDLFLARMRQKQFHLRGINFIDGPGWKDQRRFFLRHLRDYGFGRRSEQYEQEMEKELWKLVEQLASGQRYGYERDFMRDGGAVKCPDVFLVTLANIFLQVTISERYDRERAKSLLVAGRKAMLFARNADDYGTIYTYLPWLRFVFPFTIKYSNIRGGMMGVNQLLETIIDKQLQTFDPINPRHFVDVYLREMQNHVPQCNETTFQSGTAVQLSMLLERLLLNSTVVRRMQKEIDEVVDSDRIPTLNDRVNLPYTEATIREGLRIDTLIPSGIVHRAQQPIQFEGYSAPENTLFLFDLDSVNNQPEVWGDPRTFRPDRMLDEETGMLALSKDRSLTFSVGRRECPGQTYTRNVMFLIVATLVQRFELLPLQSDRLPDLSKRQTGLMHGPEDFWVRFVPRRTRGTADQ